MAWSNLSKIISFKPKKFKELLLMMDKVVYRVDNPQTPKSKIHITNESLSVRATRSQVNLEKVNPKDLFEDLKTELENNPKQKIWC